MKAWELLVTLYGVVLLGAAVAYFLVFGIQAAARWLIRRLKPGPAEYSGWDRRDGLGR